MDYYDRVHQVRQDGAGEVGKSHSQTIVLRRQGTAQPSEYSEMCGCCGSIGEVCKFQNWEAAIA